jgi:hypothetical protein
MCSRFSDFPAEIRQHIWDLSFEPRILCLHVKEHTAPRDPEGANEPNVLDTVAVTFTCTVLDPASPRVPNDIFEVRAQALPQIRWSKKMTAGLRDIPSAPTSLGPPQLYACSESRSRAAKRYQLAFGGVDYDLAAKMRFRSSKERKIANRKRKVARESWQQKKLWEKRIWVDFDNDIIVLDTMKRRDIMSPTQKITALGLLIVYAGEEVKKIKRLAVGGKSAYEICHHLKCIYHIGTWIGPLAIERFENITELLVDDSFRSPIPEIWQPGYPERQWLTGREVTKRSIVDWFVNIDFPAVRMIREGEWYEPRGE